MLDGVPAEPSIITLVAISGPMVCDEIIDKKFSRKSTNESRKYAEGKQEQLQRG